MSIFDNIKKKIDPKFYLKPTDESVVRKDNPCSELCLIGEHRGVKIYFDPHAVDKTNMLFPRKQGDGGHLTAVIVGIEEIERIKLGIDSYISLHLGKKLGIL